MKKKKPKVEGNILTCRVCSLTQEWQSLSKASDHGWTWPNGSRGFRTKPLCPSCSIDAYDKQCFN